MKTGYSDSDDPSSYELESASEPSAYSEPEVELSDYVEFVLHPNGAISNILIVKRP